ncbi:DUF6257 family protein [Streptomyces canus]|uniref:DUF6257 family protein n=1 Tax=Streptomyces canus TaxID=58343 RepID=UPI00225B6BE4|nr:DUF6257 family protein [Streptomyces canus]MCX4858963.1 DUF6257 family protein [Streptomyces canus]
MPSSYTSAEKRRIAWLAIKAGKQSLAGDRNDDTIDPKLKREMDRIEERAADRGQREVQALERKLSAARDAAAAAKATMRTSRGPERAAARREMQRHEQDAGRIERELRRYQ